MPNSSQSSNSSTDSTPIIPAATPSRRGLIFRIVGVVLFLALGTFAVSQTLMRTGHHGDESEHTDAGLATETEVAANSSATTLASQKQDPVRFKTTLSDRPKTSGNGFQVQPKTSLPKTEPVQFPKPKPTGFQVKTSPSGNFNPAPKLETKTPPIDPRSNLTALNPRKTPVVNNRLTQPEVPVVGFGGSRPKPPVVDNSNPFQSAAQRGNNLTNDLKNKTNDLAQKVSTGTQGVVRDAGKSFDALVGKAPSPPQRPSGLDQSSRPPISFQTRSGVGSGSDNRSNSTPPIRTARQTGGPPVASFDSNRNLAPLNSNELRKPGPPAQPKQDTFQAGFGQAAPRTTQQASSNPFQQKPTAQSPPVRTTAPLSRGTVPARQASTSRPIEPAVAGVVTMPTPGEKNLEGTRSPTVSVQRIAPREIQLNMPANFEIIVRNTGRIEANDVRVYDQIPTGTQLLEATPQPTSNDGKAIQWEIGKMAPGQERRIQMKLKPTQPGEIGSVAHVTFATRSSVRTLVTKPELTVTHSAPERSLIGDEVRLDIVVTNNGNGPASDVMIQEDIPTQLEYPDGFRRIEYPIGVLAPGQSRKLQLSLKAADVGRLQNTVVATGAGGLQARDSINMEIVAPKLVAQADGPRRRFLRRQATHEFTVRNNGTAAATNVEMMAKLPPGLRFVSANNQGQFDPGTNAVYWSMTELAPNGPASVSLTTVPTDTGNQDIAFTAVADLKQKVTTDAALVVEHLVDVFFDIDDVVDHIEVGSETSYQMRVVNQGTKTATNIQLNLELPPGIRPTAVEGGLEGQVQGQRVAFAPITSMNPGDEIKVAVTATGVAPGEHKVVARMQTDDRRSNVSKEETTQVYADR